jgi:hypothetical protein
LEVDTGVSLQVVSSHKTGNQKNGARLRESATVSGDPSHDAQKALPAPRNYRAVSNLSGILQAFFGDHIDVGQPFNSTPQDTPSPHIDKMENDRGEIVDL